MQQLSLTSRCTREDSYHQPHLVSLEAWVDAELIAPWYLRDAAAEAVAIVLPLGILADSRPQCRVMLCSFSGAALWNHLLNSCNEKDLKRRCPSTIRKEEQPASNQDRCAWVAGRRRTGL